MPLRSRVAWVAPVLALALLPQLAAAGPIGWSYTAAFPTDAGSDFLYLGRHARPDPEDSDRLIEGTIYGVPIVVNATGSYPGPARFRIGQLSDFGVGVFWDSEVPPPPVDEGFRVSLTIRDAASGALGDFTAFGTGAIVGDPMLYDYDVYLWLAGGTDQEQVLGGTRYRVRFSTETSAKAAWIVAEVTTDAAVTPEPGTLALAGLGLAAVGLLRASRRRAHPLPGPIMPPCTSWIGLPDVVAARKLR